MRIVVPFAGTIHPIAARALEDFAPSAERVDVSGDDYAYARLLNACWHDGEAFVVVEHDIEVNPWALSEAENCMCPWAVNPYPMRLGMVRAALGFARFAERLLRRFPDVLDEMFKRSLGDGSYRFDFWGHLDNAITTGLTERGVWWCQHATVVGHHHFDNTTGFCSCGARTTVACPSRRHHAGSLDCGPDCVPTVPTSPPAPGTTTTSLHVLLEEAAKEERRQIDVWKSAQAEQRRHDLARWERMAPQAVALEQAGRRCHDESLRDRRRRELNRWD